MARIVKVMSDGLEGGTSFMEDYTYHMYPFNGMVLGAHHSVFSQAITSEYLENLAEMANIEMLLMGEKQRYQNLKRNFDLLRSITC